MKHCPPPSLFISIIYILFFEIGKALFSFFEYHSSSEFITESDIPWIDSNSSLVALKIEEIDLTWEKVDLKSEIKNFGWELELGDTINIYWYPSIWWKTITFTNQH